MIQSEVVNGWIPYLDYPYYTNHYPSIFHFIQVHFHLSWQMPPIIQAKLREQWSRPWPPTLLRPGSLSAERREEAAASLGATLWAGAAGWNWYIWVNYNDLTVLPKPGIMVNKANHPKMAELFRFLKYSNLPRYMEVSIGFLVMWVPLVIPN
jgi:hypothetical protein